MTATDKSDDAQMINVGGVAALLVCSPRHVWRLANSPDFPRPVSIGVKLKRWRKSAIVQWLEGQAKPAAARR